MSTNNTNFSNRTLFEFVIAAIIIAWFFKNWFIPIYLGVLLIVIVKIHLVCDLRLNHERRWKQIFKTLSSEFIGQAFMSVIFMYLAYMFGIWTKPIYETVKHFFA